jgi:hypothetical protein
MMARTFPGREVLAPTVPVYLKLRLDEQGRFSDPGYKTATSSGESLTYRVRG